MSQEYSTAPFILPHSASRHHLSYLSFCIVHAMATRGTRNNKPYNVRLNPFSPQHSSRFSYNSDLHVPGVLRATGCTTKSLAQLPLVPALLRLFSTSRTRSSLSRTCIMR